MKLSVAMITYQHAAFVAQALDGVLMQETDFEFEIVLGEDASTDGTADIVRDYAARHPGKIRATFHGKNVGMMPNFLGTIQACGGEYVALLEGDDYWTDPRKLARQVAFLDAHRDHSCCYHDALVIHASGAPPHGYDLRSREPRQTLADLLAGRTKVPTASVVFRNHLFEFPRWMWTLGFGDLSTLVLCAQHGDVGFIDEKLGVYRVHGGGIWSAGDQSTASPREVKRLSALVEFYELMKTHLGGAHDGILREMIAGYSYDLVWQAQALGHPAAMRAHLRRAWKNQPRITRVALSFVAKTAALAFLPGAYALYRRLKK